MDLPEALPAHFPGPLFWQLRQLRNSVWEPRGQALVDFGKAQSWICGEEPLAVPALPLIRGQEPILKRRRHDIETVCGLGLLPDHNQELAFLPFLGHAQTLHPVERRFVEMDEVAQDIE